MAIKTFGTPAKATNNSGNSRQGVLRKTGAAKTSGGQAGIMKKGTRCASCGR